jgi:hypothetical protein
VTIFSGLSVGLIVLHQRQIQDRNLCRRERKEGKQMEDGGNGAKGKGHGGRGMKINEKKENITPTWRPRLLAEYPINDHDRLRSGDAV